MQESTKELLWESVKYVRIIPAACMTAFFIYLLFVYCWYGERPERQRDIEMGPRDYYNEHED